MDLSFWQNIDSEELYNRVATDENRQSVMQIMNKLTLDPVWTAPIIEAVQAKRIETRCFLSWLAREMQPKNYLEIGVRRGFSMAMVAAQSPETEIFGFDMWMQNYADVPNPGADFVKSEMQKIGYDKKINLTDGDSHQTLPLFFGSKKSGVFSNLKSNLTKNRRPAEFELITVDGDHSLLGAYQDLMDVMPHCAVGGVIVFDDIKPDIFNTEESEADPHGWYNLLGVWRAIGHHSPNFRFFEYLRDVPGVGLAVRLK